MADVEMTFLPRESVAVTCPSCGKKHHRSASMAEAYPTCDDCETREMMSELVLAMVRSRRHG